MLNCNYTSGTSNLFYNKCCENDEHVDTVGVYPDNKIEKALSCSTDADKWVQFSVPEVVDIPIQKPDIESVTAVHSTIEIISKKVVKTPVVTGYMMTDGTVVPGVDISNSECTHLTGRKLIIEGLIKQKIIYTAISEGNPLHSAHFDIPFSVFIIVEEDTPLSQSFKVTPYIEDIYTCRLSSRSVYKNTTIFIKASRVC